MKRVLDHIGVPGTCVAVLLLGCIGVFALVTGEDHVLSRFLTVENVMTILNAVALLGIVASGMAFVTYSGNLADLSVPSIMAFSGCVTVAALPFGLALALVCGMAAGMSIGMLNGLVIGRFRANPILWTLAVAFFMEGFMRFTWGNKQVYPDTEPGTAGAAFIHISQIMAGPVPLVVLVMLGMLVTGHLVMIGTRFGRESRYVGSSRAAAETSGLRVSRLVTLNFVVAAFAASVAGIFLTSTKKLGLFDTGQGYDFKAVTAVVIGGVMLSGGRGNMLGVLGGVLVMGILENIMTFCGITSFRQNILTGVVFIVIVGLQQHWLRRGGRDAE